MLKNVIYFPSFNSIGGVETYCYEMALKYGKDFDITILYRNGDKEQIKRLSKVCRVVRYTGQKIKCEVFIFGWGWDILDNVEAKKYVQTFHADYINRHLNPCPSEKITHRFGVAENTTKGIKDHYEWAADIQTMYNPYTPKPTKRVLHLISPTRLTPEKGKDRMITLAEALEDAGIPFIWLVFTDDKEPLPKNMVKVPTRLDILDYIADADYLVQLSDTEGYSYSVVEALCCGTPVIATDFAVVREQGIVPGKTGYILPMDMHEIPIDDIYNRIPKFEPLKPRESHYEKILAKGKSNYEQELKETTTLTATKRFYDLEADTTRAVGEKWKASKARGYDLQAKGLAQMEEPE